MAAITTRCAHCPVAAGCHAVTGGRYKACRHYDPTSDGYNPDLGGAILAKLSAGAHAPPAPVPSLARRAVNLARSVVAHVGGGLAMVGAEEKAARLVVCRGCVQFEPDRDRCRVCGCNLSVKASWKAMSCPLGKWPGDPPPVPDPAP